MKKFFAIDLGSPDRWGVAANYGTIENPKYKLLCIATETLANLIAAKLTHYRVEMEPPFLRSESHTDPGF
jgi:hypothetical protein